MAAVQQLLDLGFVVDNEAPAGTTPDLVLQGDGAVAFWTTGIQSLPEEWERFVPNDLLQLNVRGSAIMPRARVSSGVDWLSLDMIFEAEGVAVDERELRECLESGRRLVKLKDGSYAPVSSEQVGEILERMTEIFATSGDKSKLSLAQAGRIQDLLSLVNRSNVTPAARQLFSKLQDIGEIEQIAKPRQLKATLRPYQKEGFSWLVFLHEIAAGGILADDMGLGKTVQAIALLLWLKSKSKKKLRHLVVAPTSVVPNWLREIEKFGPSLTALCWQGPDREKLADKLDEADVVITS
jgi:SNF2 family DNA or RNA helicase